MSVSLNKSDKMLMSLKISKSNKMAFCSSYESIDPSVHYGIKTIVMCSKAPQWISKLLHCCQLRPVNENSNFEWKPKKCSVPSLHHGITTRKLHEKCSKAQERFRNNRVLSIETTFRPKTFRSHHFTAELTQQTEWLKSYSWVLQYGRKKTWLFSSAWNI